MKSPTYVYLPDASELEAYADAYAYLNELDAEVIEAELVEMSDKAKRRAALWPYQLESALNQYDGGQS